jgi:plasmid maintenance system killer protein
VDILFRTTKMARACNTSRERAKEFGPVQAKLLGRRLDKLRHADSLKTFKAVHPRCHMLKEDRCGKWSADLNGPYRLIFEIAEEPVPTDSHGNIALAEVTKVRIIDVTDTHGA